MGLIYFLIYLFLEILFSYEFARVFTPFGFFLEVIFSAFIGVYIVKNFHFSMAEDLQKVLKREITQEDFLTNGLFRLIGAILLIIPGIFSDILGILFLLEPFATWVSRKIFKNTSHNRFEDDDIIDVEIIEEIEEKKL